MFLTTQFGHLSAIKLLSMKRNTFFTDVWKAFYWFKGHRLVMFSFIDSSSIWKESKVELIDIN